MYRQSPVLEELQISWGAGTHLPQLDTSSKEDALGSQVAPPPSHSENPIRQLMLGGLAEQCSAAHA